MKKFVTDKCIHKDWFYLEDYKCDISVPKMLDKIKKIAF